MSFVRRGEKIILLSQEALFLFPPLYLSTFNLVYRKFILKMQKSIRVFILFNEQSTFACYFLK